MPIILTRLPYVNNNPHTKNEYKPRTKWNAREFTMLKIANGKCIFKWESNNGGTEEYIALFIFMKK